MLKVLCTHSPLCLDGSSTCAGFIAILDGNFVISKAHAYKQVKSKTVNTIIVLDSIVFGSIEFEIIVFGQILPHKIRLLSDLRSPNFQIQFRYSTPNTMPIKDGPISTRFSLSMEISRLTGDGTAEPVSRDQILRHERRQRNIHFPCSVDHVQDWQPYPVDPCSCYMCDYTYVLLIVRNISR